MIEHPQPAAAVAAMARQDIIVDARPGYLRVSPHFYNSMDDVDRFMTALLGVPT
jgi:kynureninase